MPKKSNKVSFIDKVRKLSSTKKIVLLIASIIFAVIFFNIATRLWQSYTPTKDQTTAFLQQQADKLNFNGTVVYEKIQDNGCHANETSWVGDLQMNHICTVSMQKYFKNSGDISADLVNAHEKMWALGFTGELASRSTGGASYLSNSDHSTYNFLVFNPSDNILNTNAAAFLGTDQELTLQPNEYIYGIQTVRAYNLGPFESKN